jgi:SapC protein
MAKKSKNKQAGQPSALRADPAARPTPASASRAEPGPQAASGEGQIQGQLPLFYKQPRPLHLTNHADLCIKHPINYSFAASTVAVPVLLGEFLTAGRDYPIVFGPGDIPAPVVFMGVNKTDNLFVNPDGSWAEGAYVPAYVRRYPFLLVDAGQTKRRVLFVDESSENVTHGKGNALIVDGKPSQIAQNAIKFCEAYLTDQEGTKQFCEALVAHNLLEPRNITLSLPGNRKIMLQDLRVISPKKFEELPDAVYLEWRRKKWLFPAYCHFQSALNWARLTDRAAQRAKR